MHAIRQKQTKIEPIRTDQWSDIDIIKAVEIHLAIESFKGHANEHKHKLLVYIVESGVDADWESGAPIIIART